MKTIFQFFQRYPLAHSLYWKEGVQNSLPKLVTLYFWEKLFGADLFQNGFLKMNL